jgi:glyoxylase-like metal-dependent hydrolase (beta-lactamase superfamily II)
MPVEYCVVSIGTLSCNRLWGETAAVRTAHATTTLVCEGDRAILVDPSLPGTALAARFHERTGKKLSVVTDVFCTTLRPVHRRSIDTMRHAKWWCSEDELQAYRHHLQGLLGSADRLGAEETAKAKAELKQISRFQAAPQQFSKQVQMYPLSGASAGSAGLLLTPVTTTIVIAGDAALTSAHVRQGQVWEGCADTQQALRSLEDLLELADVIIPGHDNIMLAPQRHWL